MPGSCRLLDAVDVRFGRRIGVRAAGGSCEALGADGQPRIVVFGIGRDPLHSPVPAIVVEVVDHTGVPIVVPVWIVRLDIGKVIEPATVLATVSTDELVV